MVTSKQLEGGVDVHERQPRKLRVGHADGHIRQARARDMTGQHIDHDALVSAGGGQRVRAGQIDDRGVVIGIQDALEASSMKIPELVALRMLEWDGGTKMKRVCFTPKAGPQFIIRSPS